MMTFGFYIKFAMMTYLFLLFASLYEMNYWIKGRKGKLSSRIFAFCIALFCLFTFVYALWYWIESKNDNKSHANKREKHRKCGACVSGIKPTKSKQIHIVMFFLRRLLLSFVVFLLADMSIMTKISIFTGIQLVYLLLAIIQRPFVQIKDQLIEIINECIYMILILFLFFNNDISDWSTGAKYAYIWLMLSNFVIVFIVSISKQNKFKF